MPKLLPPLLDVAVIGAGPVGLAAAVALRRAGRSVALVAPRADAHRGPDRRTFALFPSSLRFLERLGVPARPRDAAPLAGIRLVDDMGHLWRAPEITFRAGELGLDAFGLNVSHAQLVQDLMALVRSEPGIEIIEATLTTVEPRDEGAMLTLSNGRALRAALVVGADGARSPCRPAAGVATQEWTYDQAAVVTRFRHTRPHEGISTEIHRAAGPCTVVPLPGRQSALVWVERPATARRIGALDDASFCAALAERLMGLLGDIEAPDPRQVFDLRGLRVLEAGRRRIALVGEAAHVFPPIGAQGLNLGLRDVAALADAVGDAGTGDIGSTAVLAAYSASRASDIATRTFAVDLLDRSLLTRLPGVHLARGFGLHVINAVPGLRAAVMRSGLGPSALPRLMQAG